MIKKTLLTLAALLTAVIAVVLIRGALFTPSQNVYRSAGSGDYALPSAEQVAEHLSQSIRFKTLSEQSAPTDTQAFSAFRKWLADTYPTAHETLSLHTINTHTLLFHWRGSDAQKQPVLLSAHYDVVPVDPTTVSKWAHPPFAGHIDEQSRIWGRGALDDKSAVIALMEAVEAAVRQQFTPKSDIYIAFTHDEELGGNAGAKAVTEWFRDNNITPAWSLDEGSFVLDGLVPGLEKPIASINVAEKGFLTIRLSAAGAGGHSSMPPEQTAVTRISRAVVAIQDAPVPGGLSGVTGEMYSGIARHMSFDKRVLFANSWLFRPVIEQVVGRSPSGNAMLRTTTAPTMMSGSIKANVLPEVATATINFRVHPRDSIEDIVIWVKQAIDDDEIKIEVTESFPASSVSPSDNQAFGLLSGSARHVYPDAVITPGLTVAATDSHHYATLTQAYRFNPMIISDKDLDGFHGTNEHITTENMMNAVTFYSHLFRQL
ncbi:M20 family peptidase [Salinimonas iocasae]|uniref:M20/M25/M40 family metallo-hydrolase n=1 Tax=Salinimonas iocasae TaxID=2572577 RepID=A0A5B7Y9R0_9ALTE|nr:M20 family peptidase [Salinimonas iocasae]QCZ92056.1 M20/M25/M40 family metallo-hydrolase [Salinimonas iocasae]